MAKGVGEYHAATSEELETQIMRLSNTLYKLDQNYSWPDGPVYISLHSQHKPAANADGAIAMTLVGGFLSDAFTMAANDNIEGGASSLDPHGGFQMIGEWMETALELYEEHRNTAKYGAGTLGVVGDMGSGDAVCGLFCGAANDAGSSEILRHHMRIEGAISALYQQLSATQGAEALGGAIGGGSAGGFVELSGGFEGAGSANMPSMSADEWARMDTA